jgi:7,8-dihydropterin-6-yl-methyl-4-(beta-D-ribofuranosyl)aminobenzene 5'-phosphate synthase
MQYSQRVFGHITITALIDNTAGDNLSGEHGLSLWLEFGDKRILFDTGQTDMLLRNAKLLGIDLKSADAIVISHGHYDHTGGLKAVLGIAPNATIYLHPEALKPKYSQKDNKIRMIGMPDSAKEAMCVMANNGRVFWTEMPTEIFPGLFVTGTIPRITGFEDSGGNFFINQNCQKKDELLDDQAIFFETKQGLVVLLGCAHAGLVNTLDYVVKLTKQSNIYAIIGGMHLINANLIRIDNTIEALKRYDIQKIIPLHCTGQIAAEKIKKAFGRKCMSCQAGEKIVINGS